ncbi:hypothetical protein TeGR_g925 [Tetraparma gracilis]|uniref:Ubiquitin-like domain-containing protein n=1 Tax=Tetraparma gracilis TaxID=2962635 RepID=A0ABQ6M6X9_9STRA|nr:hypothetical protein TeGR_g925 [Tetraparma gracilis]
MGLLSKKKANDDDFIEGAEPPPEEEAPPPVDLDAEIDESDSAETVAAKVKARQKRRANKLLYKLSRCTDFTLKLLRLRKNVKPRLRELTVRNSEKNNEHLHLNVLWPCHCIILKKKLQSFVQIRSANQRLIFEGRILKDDDMIPEECFAKDSKDGKELVSHIWMINVGFSMDKFAKKYTVDGKEYFSNKAEMEAFYAAIEREKQEKDRRASTAGIKNKFMKVKAGFNFFNLAAKEPPAKPHNAIVEELITTATKYNARDDWDLPTRPNIFKGFMEEKFIHEKHQEDEYLNQMKMNMWMGDLHEKFAAADAFHTGHVAIHDLRRIVKKELEMEHVHEVDKTVDMIIHKSETGDCHYDHDIIVKESIKVMMEALTLHISGKQLRAQSQRLAAEADKKKKMYYWIKDDEDLAQERKEELGKITVFNCPAFEPQPFDDRRCKWCKNDRSLHTIIHTKKDYEVMIARRNADIMSAAVDLGEANEIAARQAETKRKLKLQNKKLGGAKIDWEDTDA